VWVKGPKNWSKWSGVRLLDIFGTFALYKSKKSIKVSGSDNLWRLTGIYEPFRLLHWLYKGF